jgi:CHAT domain-containing protein
MQVLLLLLATIGSSLGCSRSQTPWATYEHARLTFVHGDLVVSQQEAEAGYQRFRRSSPEWAWKFRVLEGESLLWRGKYRDVLTLLGPSAAGSAPKDLTVSVLALQAVAYARQLDLTAAENKLEETERLCADATVEGCGEAAQARGLFALGQNQFADAREHFQDSLSLAKTKGDKFLETTSLLNLGGALVKEGLLDEAIDSSDAAYRSALVLQADDIALAAQENLAWSYYRLGDSARALDLLLEAERRSEQLGDTFDQENGLTNIGYVYMDERKFDLAEGTFSNALRLARSEGRKEHMLNALRVLARLSLQKGDTDNASLYVDQALDIAHEGGNHLDELYPKLVQGQVAARRGDAAKARQIFEEVEGDQLCPVFLKWDAEHSLAQLYESQNQLDSADVHYRVALAMFEAARSNVRREDFQLSFLTNAAHIYDEYVHFLVAQKKTEEALRWADYSRARTLAEGLGLISKGALDRDHAAPPALNPRAISRRAQGTLLFYWLGERQSYLWAITPSKTVLFSLPPGAEIDSLVQRYRNSLNGPQDVLASSEDGRALYRTLIAPAKALLPSNAKVFIIPDGSLNNLNFETLIVADPKPHYWIEDADVVNASSLRVLAASFIRENARERKRPRKLLLIGDSVAPNKEYPELPRAGDQMASVARHFPAMQVYQREQANPAAYLASNPGKFSHIHFVAHGTASRLSPLDSAIVLSKGAAETDSFKLYARDIVQHPLQADLVTISACYGAGSRSYSGEGLVGLAWAFLRAGAHNVIASLWEVTDASTEQLMERFYDELDRGASPDAALRAAKLSLLRGSAFHNPFYWAPFQLYTGS